NGTVIGLKLCGDAVFIQNRPRDPDLHIPLCVDRFDGESSVGLCAGKKIASIDQVAAFCRHGTAAEMTMVAPIVGTGSCIITELAMNIANFPNRAIQDELLRFLDLRM